MSVWRPRPVSDAPRLLLTQWAVFEVGTGKKVSRHFVGWCASEDEARVSSAIQEYDVRTMIGITHTGREYQLTGEPGFCSLGILTTWQSWLTINKINSRHVKVVTGEYEDDCKISSR